MNGSYFPLVRRMGAGLALTALVVLLGLFAASDNITAHSFNPTGTACLDDFDTDAECDGTYLPGANDDVRTTFDIPAPDANFSAVITFTPPEWGVASDADVPGVGAWVGQLTSTATLGLINSPCWQSLTPTFNLYDSTTDIANSQDLVFANWFLDDDNDGLMNFVEIYPEFLNRIFDNQQPRARLAGWANVSGVDVMLNFVIFEPGTTIGGETLDPSLGYPSVTVLQAIGDPEAEPTPSSITDFCTPLSTVTTTFGMTKDNPNTTEDNTAGGVGVPYRTNPPDGGYNFVTFARSQLDADNDGIENGLDTCPFTATPGFDPRATDYDPTDDPDMDGIPGGGPAGGCDPTPTEDTGLYDHDLDGYQNRGDNCPLVDNGTGTTNQQDSDLDGIGDECDLNPTEADGHYHQTCVVSEVDVGAGGDPPSAEVPPCAAAVLTCDADGGGAVDIVDALVVAQYVVGLIGSEDLSLTNADVDGDGEVTIVDALLIAQDLVGLADVCA